MGNVLYVDKPSGMTSFDLCYKLRKVLQTKKIGHTGTLDPLATGVMIILFDKATKANQFLVSDDKCYEARIRLGIETDSLDTEGNVIKESPFVVPDRDRLIEVLASFQGPSSQIVPITSAIKVHGKRLYAYQHENKEVELPVREIMIHEICLKELYEDGFSFACKVSSGTYIRALARDILKKLDLIGCISELRRTAIDEITIGDCQSLDEILNGDLITHDLYDLLSRRYETIDYPDPSVILNGKRITADSEAAQLLIAHDKEVLAIYVKDGKEYRCQRGLW